MPATNLTPGEPLILTLAADSRLSQTSYPNDHIWEISLGGGEPPSLAIQTTFGLRARNFRIFPRFTLQDTTHGDPAAFAAPIVIKYLAGNFVRLSCVPHPGINVEIEYWVPTSQSLAGRTIITNTRPESISLGVEWVALLTPDASGQRMALTEIGLNRILAGKSSNLNPIFYLTGLVQTGTGPYTALSAQLTLGAQETHTLTWFEAALATPEASFTLAQQISRCNWEAEISRIEHLNASLLDIHTGDPEWNAAFMQAQTIARELVLSNPDALPNPSTVSTRLPDQGYSLRGDGSDYTHLWDGQTLFDLYYLMGLLLPGESSLIRGFLKNFLAAQASDGDIPRKLGLGGQVGKRTAPPMLACLVWRYYQFTGDIDFLESSFPNLLSFVQSWFSPTHDRDSDGIPEWDHLLQTGNEDHPVFAHWHPWAQGLDISIVESPDLCAYLYNEIETLVQIAFQVKRPDAIPALTAHSEHLREAVEASWNESTHTYPYWDRESHHSSLLAILGARQGPGNTHLNTQFTHPTRLLIRLDCTDETTRPVQGFIHGAGPSGSHRVERFASERFRWHLGIGRCTSERIYASLEHVEIQGIKDTDRVTLQTPGLDCRDIFSLLPLWAGIPSKDHARSLIKNTITNPRLFWGAYGLRTCADKPGAPTAMAYYDAAHPLWNSLVGEGLLRYGSTRRATDLVTRLMGAIVHNLKQQQAFFRSYLASNARGEGERNALLGLAPLGLFLQVLGVQIISPWRVKITAPNPFPWPVTIKYKGLTLIQQSKKALVIFPDGQSVTLRNDKPQEISLD